MKIPPIKIALAASVATAMLAGAAAAQTPRTIDRGAIDRQAPVVEMPGTDDAAIQAAVRASRINTGRTRSSADSAAAAPALEGNLADAGSRRAGIALDVADADVLITQPDVRQPYILGYVEQPLASYRGDLDRLPAAPRTAGGRIDVHAGEAQAYADFLQSRQIEREAAMSTLLRRPVQAMHRMQHAFNGVVVELTPSEAERLSRMRDIALMEPYQEYTLDSDTGPLHINADTVWDSGSGLPGSQGAQGEGVVFGIIDSGANVGSPSFAVTDMDGYTHTNPLGAGVFLGDCADGGSAEGSCNDKLIGGYDFICPLTPHCDDPALREEPGIRDTSGHGSHVASTVAGNRRIAEYLGNSVEISGVAPRGNLVVFNACYLNTAGQGLCPNVSTLASINQAVADGVVDGISYSISGGSSPWTESNALAFLAATDAGIYVSASGGNSGPTAGTGGRRGPWIHTIAAAQHGRGAFAYELQITGAPAAINPVFVTPGINGVGQDGDIPGETPFFVSPGIDSADDGCAAFPAGQFEDGIAMIRRGGCPFSDKVNNADAAGAIAVVIANVDNSALSPSVPGTQIPAYAVPQSVADQVRDFVASNPGATAGIPFAASIQANTPDQLAGFSSRGPAQFDVIKPDVTGPGVLILAADAGPELDGFDDIVGLKSGTSMSQPHNLGAAGLLRQLNPDWTVAEIKSALMMTAEQSVLLEDGSTPANPLAGGSGSIRVDRAARAGLVLDETTANFEAANPVAAGDPSTLNLASMANTSCEGTCSFSRTFTATTPPQERGRMRNTLSGTYDVDIEGLPGTVSHTRFRLNPGQSITLDVEIDATGLTPGAYSFGQLVLVPVDPTRPTLRLPIAVVAQEEPVDPPPPGDFLVDTWTGAVVTHPGGGFGGADASRLQSSLGMTSFGPNANIAGGFALADEFTVPAGGWSIESFSSLAYQTNSGPASTLTGLSVWILDGPPDDPSSTIVFGDDTTNVLTSTTFSGIYRDTENAPGTSARPLMEAVAVFEEPVELEAGTYWVAYGFAGSVASGPWGALRTLPGETVTGSSLQRIADGSWQALVDGGSLTAQGVPYRFTGTAD